jgi:hypothetical protein
VKLIQKGSSGPNIKKIQIFLRGLKFYLHPVDTSFGPNMETAVKAFQKKNGLIDDGIIGNGTLSLMLRQGLALMPEVGEFPPKPEFAPLLSNTQRQNIFGTFKYKDAPTKSNPEGIIILGDWEAQNIVEVILPELSEATNGKYTKMRVHKLIANQMRGLWAEWKSAGLLHLVKTYEGAFYPRYIRGSSKSLSNHSWGTAFDINYEWNMLGQVPAQVGEVGSVRELVPIAHKWGFYWGGHFTRKDGMHMEIAKVLS